MGPLCVDSPALLVSRIQGHLILSLGQTPSLPVAWCAQLPEALELQILCQDTLQTSMATSVSYVDEPVVILSVPWHVPYLFQCLAALLAVSDCPVHEQCWGKAALHSSPKQHGLSLAPAKLPGVLH